MIKKEKLHEECAVLGVNLKNNETLGEAAGIVYNGLLALQHRGQEGSGIAVAVDNSIFCLKDTGLAGDVFNDGMLQRFPESHAAVGHNRYSTTGSSTQKNVQPFITEYLTGRIATVHNGNITNAVVIREMLKKNGVYFEATSDSEVISSLTALCMVKSGSLEEGVRRAASILQGAFSMIVLCSDEKMVAVRDSNGYRPLCIGKSPAGICVASESCALDSCGFSFYRDVAPGEIIIMENGEIISSSTMVMSEEKSGLCIFEYVYFARPDSVIDNLCVYEARYNMGAALAEEHPANADVVCGVPDSGLAAAIGYSATSGIPLVSGFVKNRYVGRSFIYPTQIQRESAVRLKLNPLTSNVYGKSIVLVDDSIVRGTTCKKILESLRNAGAKEIHVRVSSPPFRYTCHYGTDIGQEENLIANRMSEEEIRREIGADSLGYISMDRLIKACAKCKVALCTKCFTGYDIPQEKL